MGAGGVVRFALVVVLGVAWLGALVLADGEGVNARFAGRPAGAVTLVATGDSNDGQF